MTTTYTQNNNNTQKTGVPIASRRLPHPEEDVQHRLATSLVLTGGVSYAFGEAAACGALLVLGAGALDRSLRKALGLTAVAALLAALLACLVYGQEGTAARTAAWATLGAIAVATDLGHKLSERRRRRAPAVVPVVVPVPVAVPVAVTVVMISMMVMMAVSVIVRMTVFMVEPLTGPRIVGKDQ